MYYNNFIVLLHRPITVLKQSEKHMQNSSKILPFANEFPIIFKTTYTLLVVNRVIVRTININLHRNHESVQ